MSSSPPPQPPGECIAHPVDSGKRANPVGVKWSMLLLSRLGRSLKAHIPTCSRPKPNRVRAATNLYGLPEVFFYGASGVGDSCTCSCLADLLPPPPPLRPAIEAAWLGLLPSQAKRQARFGLFFSSNWLVRLASRLEKTTASCQSKPPASKMNVWIYVEI